MSNYDLQSKLNELEQELREAERYNAELRGELSTVANGVSRADRNLEEYNALLRGTLEKCNNSMQSSHQRVIDAMEVQYEIEKLYVRFKQVELANKKIRAANNVKYYDFANYRMVRKIVRGIMDNLDLHMVSDQTITKSVEVQHLQTPDYWLTCALISIMAWKNDDRELAGRAIARAISLDKKNSAIFYMLFNLRMRREEAALKWFATYQECELKGSDQRTFLMLFSLIAKTLSDSVNDDTKSAVSTFIQKVIDSNRKASGYSEQEVIAQICRYFARMQPSEQIEYPMLRKHCTDFDTLSAIMTQAKNNKNILAFFLQTIHVPEEQKNTFLKEYIDELIAAPNQSEKDVYDEIAYNELVIRYEGDVEKARAVYEAEQTKNVSELNLIAEMTHWIYERDTQEVNGQIRLNMFTLTKYLQEKAVDAYVEEYRRRRKVNQMVRIGEYTAEVNFNRVEEAYSKTESYFKDKCREAVSAIKNWKAYVGFGVGAAALIGAFFAGYWLFVGTLACAGYGSYVLVSHAAQVKQLNRKCAESIRNTNDVLRELYVEFQAYQTELDEYDAYYARIKNELDKV